MQRKVIRHSSLYLFLLVCLENFVYSQVTVALRWFLKTIQKGGRQFLGKEDVGCFRSGGEQGLSNSSVEMFGIFC